MKAALEIPGPQIIVLGFDLDELIGTKIRSRESFNEIHLWNNKQNAQNLAAASPGKARVEAICIPPRKKLPAKHFLSLQP